jgi:hypothetical protein
MLALSFLALSVGLVGAAPNRVLPNPMIGGYANWGECDNSVLRAARSGVNVILWFSINLSPSAPPTGGPNLTCVGNVLRNLSASGLPTTSLISVGGWDAPHPTGGSGAQFYAQWQQWNAGLQATYGFAFDGVDWDLEGNDIPASLWNTFSVETLSIVGEFSQLAKADGYLITLVPAESYFDVSTAAFSRSLNNSYSDWHSDFLYHGHNAYAYLFSKYGGAATFDAVTVQLYESWSHAGFNITLQKQRPADYLRAWAASLAAGWWVDFSSAPELNYSSQMVTLPLANLVVGLANGWAGGAGSNVKSLLIMPEEVGVAWAEQRFRGAAFWCIAAEGNVPPAQTAPLYLASGLNAFFHARPAQGGEAEE